MNEPIRFILTKIITEQFAVLKDMYRSEVPFNVRTELSFGTQVENKVVVVSTSFRFESDDKQTPFIMLETRLFFNIEAESWNKLYDPDKNTLALEKGFARHLGVIAVGTARGVLHSKTEDTDLNHITLPLINVEEILQEDVIIELVIN